MNELKALVRAEAAPPRNFWANHRTRDEVVYALYEHRQHQLELVATRRKLKDRETGALHVETGPLKITRRS